MGSAPSGARRPTPPSAQLSKPAAATAGALSPPSATPWHYPRPRQPARLAGFGAVQSFLDRTKHRTATQLAAAETSPGTSKFESNLPGWEDSNFDVTQADRLGRGSQCRRDGDCGQETVQPNREHHSPLGPQPSPPRRLNPKPRDVPKR